MALVLIEAGPALGVHLLAQTARFLPQVVVRHIHDLEMSLQPRGADLGIEATGVGDGAARFGFAPGPFRLLDRLLSLLASQFGLFALLRFPALQFVCLALQLLDRLLILRTLRVLVARLVLGAPGLLVAAAQSVLQPFQLLRRRPVIRRRLDLWGRRRLLGLWAFRRTQFPLDGRDLLHQLGEPFFVGAGLGRLFRKLIVEPLDLRLPTFGDGCVLLGTSLLAFG